MKKIKFLTLYKRYAKAGVIPELRKDGNDGGLCGLLGEKTMDLFTPTLEDCEEYNLKMWGYWAADVEYGRSIDFGPTRQNIVLFLAAMNDEL